MADEDEEKTLEVGQLTELEEHTGTASTVSWVFIAVAAVALGIMMFIELGDVVGRYFFLHPIQGTAEIVGLLMIVSTGLGLGWCQLVKGNIRVELLSKRLSRRGQAILSISSYLMSIVVCVLVSWQGALMTYDYMVMQLGSITPDLSIKLWPFMLIMTIGFTWVTVIFIIDLVKSCKEAFGR